MIFVTVCTKDRRAVLANARVHDVLLAAWANARDWRVGRYVIMPDHVHFFCAPGRLDYPALSKWMAYWKSLVARKEKGFGALAESEGPGGTSPSRKRESGKCGPGGTGPSRRKESDECGRGGTGPSRRKESDECGPGGTGPSMGNYGPALVWQRDFWDRQLRSGESYGEKWHMYAPIRSGRVWLIFPGIGPIKGKCANCGGMMHDGRGQGRTRPAKGRKCGRRGRRPSRGECGRRGRRPSRGGNRDAVEGVPPGRPDGRTAKLGAGRGIR